MRVRRHLPTVLISIGVATVTASTPAIGHGVQHALFAHNADKVDGKHAVGSGATLNTAAGKLVATDSTGPNQGRISTKFLPRSGAVSASRANDLSTTIFTITKIPFDVEQFDTAAMHSNGSNPTRLTAPVAGLYQVSAGVTWAANNSGHRQIYIMKNGNVVQYRNGPSGGDLWTSLGVDALLSLAKGDYVEIAAWQNSGGDLSVLGAGTCGSDCTSATMHFVGNR